MSRMLGPQVIEDQAIIGRDLFMEDGAATRVTIQIEESILAADITRRRTIEASPQR